MGILPIKIYIHVYLYIKVDTLRGNIKGSMYVATNESRSEHQGDIGNNEL